MSEPQRFRKKPVEIEAMQWDGTAEGATPIINWALANNGSASYACDRLNADGSCPGGEGDHHLTIPTLEGTMTAGAGDWIIRGVKGEFYPCKPDIFEATYDAVEGEPE